MLQRQLYNDGFILIFQRGMEIYAQWIKEKSGAIQEYQRINMERKLDMVMKAIFRKKLLRFMITEEMIDGEQCMKVKL